MSEENGSAEQQGERMDKRAAEGSVTGERYRGEGYGVRGSKTRSEAMRQLGRRVRAKPSVLVIAALALIAMTAAAIAIRNDQARPGLRMIRRRSRVLADAFQERDVAVKPRALAMVARLAAVGLAGLTWRRMRALGRDHDR